MLTWLRWATESSTSRLLLVFRSSRRALRGWTRSLSWQSPHRARLLKMITLSHFIRDPFWWDGFLFLLGFNVFSLLLCPSLHQEHQRRSECLALILIHDVFNNHFHLNTPHCSRTAPSMTFPMKRLYPFGCSAKPTFLHFLPNDAHFLFADHMLSCQSAQIALHRQLFETVVWHPKEK
jgi:hypothetical protein